MIFIISAVALLFVYLTVAVIVNGIPDSISETYYTLSPLAFQFLMVVIAGFTITGLLEVTEGRWYQFLGVLTGAGMLFVGVAPRYRSYERQIHYSGAIVTIASAVILSCLYYSVWILGIWLICPLRVYKSKLLWIELLCVLTLMFSVVAGTV